MVTVKNECCELCLRQAPLLTRHHLIPRTRHRNKRIRAIYSREELHGRVLMLCKSCHKQVHNLIPEKLLADVYNTRESLLEHDELAQFLNWISRKPADFVARSYRKKK